MTVVEPYGHRGHPYDYEVVRSSKVAERAGVAITCLQTEGFLYDEALAFLSGLAHEAGRQLGETWRYSRGSIRTIEGLLLGRAAKTWSLDAIDQAITEIQELL